MKNLSKNVQNEILEMTWNKSETKKSPLSENAKMNIIILSMTSILALSVALINLFF